MHDRFIYCIMHWGKYEYQYEMLNISEQFGLLPGGKPMDWDLKHLVKVLSHDYHICNACY